MISEYVLVAVLAASHASKLPTPKHMLRVIMDTNNSTLKYPYVVALKSMSVARTIFENINYELIFCTGSLITARWVLTAAHCCMKEVTHVQYGNMSIPLVITESKSNILKMVRHPRYAEPVFNDIGLLLVSPAKIDKYGKVSAADYLTLRGASVQFAGFRLTWKGEKFNKQQFLNDLFRPLQTGEAVVSRCQKYMNLICISLRCRLKQKEVKEGDSGGPLHYDNRIIGVTRGHTPEESLYTPTSPYLSWINNVIKTNSA